MLDYSWKTSIKNPLKQCSTGQAIVSTVKPRSALSPILFAVGVEMDHKFACKWQLIKLSQLRFSVSTDEVTKYKQSTVVDENVNDIRKRVIQDSFSQWSRNNVDPNSPFLRWQRKGSSMEWDWLYKAHL